ncbi:MAG: selenocysteine-specific translation elongation factor [Candidatus Adiutrix sp.]|jgi:selenocysteine-specific elongation factor|nr:selenocysteine-specific translation elongation factor [Candidatus Adiutrix sp.]
MAKRRHAVIGTAGHVDHGKTSLVRALTGIDTDRLAEEKKRGITIENGFAHLDLPDGGRAGIVDVPGHEHFIKNMLAGSGGIDVALLVIAADDGVMPQTREHLDILRLLDIQSGLVALTKRDLADADWAALMREEIAATVAGTFLESAPIVEVSAHSGQGLEELRGQLIRLIESRPSRDDGKMFRLPIDRVFTLTGFGTVVTGTLMEGRLAPGDAALVYPDLLPAKIRSLQVHSQSVEAAYPGQRVAVNLANLKKEELGRGDVLATEGSLRPTMMLDVRLSVLEASPHPVKSGSLVHLYLGAKELLAKAVLMDEAELGAGTSGYAQLRLMEPVTAKKGDRFVIRFYSPMTTIGGGVVLDGAPLKRRRHKPEILQQFETKDVGSHLQRVELAVIERPGTFPSLEELISRADLDRARARNDAHTLAERGFLTSLTRDVFIHKTELDRLKRRLGGLLADWHRANPYSPGMSLEEARSRMAPQAGQAVSEALFSLLEDEKMVKREGGDIRLASFEPQVNEAENELIAKLEQLYQSFGLAPPATSAVEPADTPAAQRRRKAAFAALLRQGTLVRLDDLYHLHQSHYQKALHIFKDLAANGAIVELGQYRDALSSSRKLAVALLENFDQLGISEKSGLGRRLKQ